MWRRPEKRLYQSGGLVTYSGPRRRGRRRRRRRLNPGKKALMEVRRVKRIINKNVNFKFLTTNTAIALAATTPQYASLVLMVRGVTDELREGDEITIHSITFRFKYAANDGETAPTNFRIALIYDRRPAGVQATWNQVFNANESWSLINNSVEEDRGRFQILYDKSFVHSQTGNEMSVGKGYIKTNLKVIYNLGTAVIDAVRKGNLFWAFIQDGGSLSGNLKVQTRIKFTDTN